MQAIVAGRQEAGFILIGPSNKCLQVLSARQRKKAKTIQLILIRVQVETNNPWPGGQTS
jgi:hypothetical protein